MFRIGLLALFAFTAGPKSAPFPAPSATPTKSQAPTHRSIPAGRKAKPTKAPAQVVPTTPKAKPLPGGTPGGFGRALTVAWGANGQKTKRDLRFGAHAAALSSFDLRFENGDHKISRIGVFRSEGNLASDLRDHDGNDRYQFKATFTDLPGVAAKKTRLQKYCQVVCDLEIQSPNKGEVFVLTGFLFTRPKRDGQVHRIAVLPRPEFGVVRVVFDDGRPPGAKSEFKAQIQYAYLPKAKVKAITTETHRSARGGTVSMLGGQWGTRVIRAFDLQFGGARHFLNRLRIEQGKGQYLVDLRDRNGGDGFNASVDYVMLRVPKGN